MSEESVAPVARARRDSTRALRATPRNVDDLAAFLFLDHKQTEAAHLALDGEPMKRVLGVLDWLLQHESDPDYSPRDMLLGWAKSRQAGCYRPTPAQRITDGSSDDQLAEIEASLPPSVHKPDSEDRRIARSIAAFWMERPEELVSALDRMGG
jgi:hypothetical protein